MNKIFKVKRNSRGQSVVCSEIAKSHTSGKITAIAAGIALALVSGGAHALTALEGAKDTGAGYLAVGEQATADNSYALGDSSLASAAGATAFSGSEASGVGSVAMNSSVSAGHGSLSATGWRLCCQ